MEKYCLKKFEYNKLLNKLVNKYELYRPLWNLLPILHKYYKLAVIRNASSLTLPLYKMKYEKINENFDLFISSGLEDAIKPNKKIYLLTAKRLGVDPKKCLFIDDLPENIKGAEKISMKTILWRKPDKSLKKLMAILNIK